MTSFAKALESLQEPKNEPLNWLLGDSLRAHALGIPESNFLLEALARPRTATLMKWNAWIHEYRELLRNPATAPRKTALDLKARDRKDAEEKLRSLLAEVQAVLHLAKLRYKDFEVLMPDEAPSPDFSAQLDARPVRIEVKNMREPEDIIRTVASRHWHALQKKRPEEYDFSILVSHEHRGSLSSKARKRLCSILDLLPKTKKSPILEQLDDGVRVSIKRLEDQHLRAPNVEGLILSDIVRKQQKPGRMIVQSRITADHMAFDLSELQGLFLKVLRRVIDSSPKFFGDTFVSASLNVVALRWEPPDIFASTDVTTYVADQTERFFAAFTLQLKPIIFFAEPEIPKALIKQYE